MSPVSSGNKRLVWVTYLFLDLLFHKTSRIEILEHLAKRGYTVYLVGVHSQRKFELKNSNINVVSIPLRYVPGLSPLLFTCISLFIFPFYLISRQPDFVIVEPGVSSLGFLWRPIFRLFRRTRFILDVRSTPVETIGTHGRLEAFLFRISVFLAKVFFDGITIITSLMKNEVCENFRIDKRFVGVWTSGVSQELFDPMKYSEGTHHLRRKLGLDEKFVVFYHGYLGVKRGILESVRSIPLIANQWNDIVLFLLGNGPALSEIENEIVTSGLQGRVIVHPPVSYNDVPKYIAMCDVGIVPLPDLPDWKFQCPLKLLELMSMKKPVILTRIPAHKEVISDEECGIYVSSADPAEIAHAIAFARKNRDNLQHMGTCGKSIIASRYTWDKVAKDFDGYLSKI